MPPAKRLKSSAESSRAASSRADTETDGEFASVAKQHWLKTTKRASKVKVKNDVLKREIWDALEKDGFQFKSLLALEGLQTLERYVITQTVA
jgi:intron-binding protein aquarius